VYFKATTLQLNKTDGYVFKNNRQYILLCQAIRAVIFTYIPFILILS